MGATSCVSSFGAERLACVELLPVALLRVRVRRIPAAGLVDTSLVCRYWLRVSWSADIADSAPVGTAGSGPCWPLLRPCVVGWPVRPVQKAGPAARSSSQSAPSATRASLADALLTLTARSVVVFGMAELEQNAHCANHLGFHFPSRGPRYRIAWHLRARNSVAGSTPFFPRLQKKRAVGRVHRFETRIRGLSFGEATDSL